MLDKIGFKDQILKCEDFPQPQSNRGHKVSVILEAFITSIWCGDNRFMHTAVTRNDVALGKIFNWESNFAQDTYIRFFNKFDQTTDPKVSDYFYSWIFDNFKFDNFTLDVDFSVMIRYGNQEGAKKGYNLGKKGSLSHHPLIAFVSSHF